jgi:hypothetical protein
MVAMPPCFGYLNIENGGISTYQLQVGTTVNAQGRISESVYKVTIPHAVWTAADVAQSIIVGALVPKAKIIGIISDTTIAYAGLGGTIQLNVGVSSGGSELIVAHDVKSGVVTKGLADADLGTSINRTNAVQGGYIPSWTGHTYLYATLTSGTGNLGNGSATNLSNGSTTIYVTTQAMP